MESLGIGKGGVGVGSNKQDDHGKQRSAQTYRCKYTNCRWLRCPGVAEDTGNSEYEAYRSKEDTKRVSPTQEMG